MTMRWIGLRYHWARRWRTCPACRGRGDEVVDWATFRTRACYLCDGGGEVRFTIPVSVRIALRIPSRLMRENIAEERRMRRRHRLV